MTDPAPTDEASALRALAAGAARPARRPHQVLARIARNVLYTLVAFGLLAGYEHYALHQQSTESLACLVGAGGFALAPVRTLLHVFFALESRVLHVVHGLGGLAFIGLAAGGAIKGGPVLTHAALAPFAMMGAAQAVMHQNTPRNAEQAAALRRFATSLPEVEQFTRAKDLTSPANIARAVAVLSDLIGKAQALGETELKADPQFQSALRQATTHAGLTLGLDSLDTAIGRLAKNPEAAASVTRLREQLAAARKTVAAT